MNDQEVTDNTFTVTENAEEKMDCHYLHTWSQHDREWIYYNFWKDATTQNQMGTSPAYYASIDNTPNFAYHVKEDGDPLSIFINNDPAWNLEQTITYGLGVKMDQTSLMYNAVTIQYFPYDTNTGEFTATPVALGEEPTGTESAFAARGCSQTEKVRISYIFDGTTLYLDREVILMDGRKDYYNERLDVRLRAKREDIRLVSDLLVGGGKLYKGRADQQIPLYQRRWW